jgi:hypothetical protein
MIYNKAKTGEECALDTGQKGRFAACAGGVPTKLYLENNVRACGMEESEGKGNRCLYEAWINAKDDRRRRTLST